MYAPHGYYGNKPGSDEGNSAERLPYRQRNRTPKVHAHEKWKEACLKVNPDFDNLSESAKEMIESKLKVEYYIALGADSSVPRTATSGSFQTPRASPLVRRPPRAPPRAPSAPVFPTRQLPPIGPLPPLPLQPHYNVPAPVPPFGPVTSIHDLPTLPDFLAAYPHFNPYYQEKHFSSLASTSTNSNFLEDPYIRKRPPDPNPYREPGPSFAVPKLGQSASRYVDCPSIYGTDNFFNTFQGETHNNNDATINSNDDNDQPFDYTIEALNQFNF